MIAAYLDALAAALRFDPALARRVREEAADHLQQAIAADRSDDRVAAERRAIAEFGDVEMIAAQFEAISLARRVAKLRVALILAVASVFVAMKGRVTWYAMTGWNGGHDVSPVTRAIASIDRYAFWSSLIIAVGAFAYLAVRPVAPTLQRGLRQRVRRVRLLGMAAVAPLAVAVISDGVLTSIKLASAELSIASLVPIATMVIEIACIALLSVDLARTWPREPLATGLRA